MNQEEIDRLDAGIRDAYKALFDATLARYAVFKEDPATREIYYLAVAMCKADKYDEMDLIVLGPAGNQMLGPKKTMALFGVPMPIWALYLSDARLLIEQVKQQKEAAVPKPPEEAAA